MLYTILKPLTYIFYRIYYKVEHKGREKTPFRKPVILAPNHNNGFIDPVVLATILPNKVRGFARGDIFKGSFVKWALNSMNISPIYRIQEGFSAVKKNDKTFEECHTLLSDNQTLLIFPEGICVQQKRLQNLKKGLARIVFQTEDFFDFKKNVWIVPVGINYSNAKKFRSNLFVNFGEPMSIKKYEELYQQDKVKAIINFTRDLEQEMTKLIITIKNKDNDELVEMIIEIYLYQWMTDKQYNYKSIEKKYYVSKEIVGMINYHDEVNPNTIESLKKKIIPYHNKLKKYNLRDHLLRPEAINKMNLWNFFLNFSIICFGIPLYFIGLAMNYPPYYISRNFAKKKAKKVEFHASVFANMAMILWILYFAIQLLIVALVFRNWTLLAIYALVVPITGLYVLNFYSVIKKTFGNWRLIRFVHKEKKTVEELLKDRLQIITEIDLAKKEYLASLQG